MEKFEKDSRYSFRINSELKDKFKVYCKIMNVSPSDVLCAVIDDFNCSTEKILEMKDISELRKLFQEKVTIAEKEFDTLKAKKGM